MIRRRTVANDKERQFVGLPLRHFRTELGTPGVAGSIVGQNAQAGAQSSHSVSIARRDNKLNVRILAAGTLDTLLVRALLSLRRDGQSEKHEHGLIESQDILVVQPADTCTNLGLGDSGDLIHRQAARRAQAVALVRLDWQAEQRRVRLVSGEGADRDRVGGVEAVVLNNDDGAWLPGIILAAGDGPDVATLHSSPQSDTASMNA